MTADVHFVREPDVLLFNYSDPLTLVEIETSLEVFGPLLQEASTPVHSIFEVTHLTFLPPKVLSTFLAKQMMYEPMLVHPMRGLSVIVTSNVMISAVTSVAVRAFSTQKVRVVRTIDQAWAEIDHYGIKSSDM